MKPEGKNKKKLILGILLGLSIFIWGRNLAPVKKKLGEIGRQFKAVASQHMPKRKALRTQAKDYGRNPFVASGVSESGISGLQLGGIISDAKERYALINDQIAHPGDIIGAYKVVRIDEFGVIVNDGNKDIELKLEQ
ncbi:MAG: hypothetical protein A3G37_03485 [Omnitrophica WOR_2 bacterium RIFCSPLOWO2_12_FULL_46_30]|nr:MAG: hypothetical protein A3H41_01180 [Omnitrophica WOR_2 bacterium RIFCSPLOWO2_02_FULL_45_28]OGX52306.1 MAG: hypothetical protein A3G37_03485 [Omnitrophica WOR_2 bacterium RIFCSPLOWO2_12_FULL_46_30]